MHERLRGQGPDTRLQGHFLCMLELELSGSKRSLFLFSWTMASSQEVVNQKRPETWTFELNGAGETPGQLLSASLGRGL